MAQRADRAGLVDPGPVLGSIVDVRRRPTGQRAAGARAGSGGPRCPLWERYAELHRDHLALKLVTMTMIGMMPLNMREAIIAQLEPGLDRNPHLPSIGLTIALGELFNDMRGIPPSEHKPADEDMSHIL